MLFRSKTPVGDRHVVEEMKQHGYNVGGEQSGHLVFLDHNTTGDGLISALQVLAILKRREMRFSKLTSVVKKLPQVIHNVKIREKRPLDSMKDVTKTIASIESKLQDTGRVLIRYSGTENVVRVMLEGEDERKINEWSQEICAEIQKEIGA